MTQDTQENYICVFSMPAPVRLEPAKLLVAHLAGGRVPHVGAEVVDVRPGAPAAQPARLALARVLVVQVLGERVGVVVGEEALHAHQLLGVAGAVLAQGGLVGEALGNIEGKRLSISHYFNVHKIIDHFND